MFENCKRLYWYEREYSLVYCKKCKTRKSQKILFPSQRSALIQPKTSFGKMLRRRPFKCHRWWYSRPAKITAACKPRHCASCAAKKKKTRRVHQATAADLWTDSAFISRGWLRGRPWKQRFSFQDRPRKPNRGSEQRSQQLVPWARRIATRPQRD